MDGSLLLMQPAEYLDRLSLSVDFAKLVDKLLALTGNPSEIHEVFCRTGELGSHFLQRNVDWRGIDLCPQMIACAKEKHGNLVEHKDCFGYASVTTLIGWFAPLSIIEPPRLPSFCQHIGQSLGAHGRAYIQQWYFPDEARQGYSVMKQLTQMTK